MADEEEAAAMQHELPLTPPADPLPQVTDAAPSAAAPAALVVRDPPTVEVLADRVTRRVIRALLDDGREERQDPARGPAVETSQSLVGGRGEIVIRVTEANIRETWDLVLAALQQVGDEVVDVFCALLVLAMDANGVERISDPFYLSADDLLRVCNPRETDRAFTSEQCAAVMRHLGVLARPIVNATLPNPLRDRRRRGRSPVLRLESRIVNLLGGVIGEYEVASGARLWVQQSVAIGDWVRWAPPLSRETAQLLREVLAYREVRERAAKRLGRYLTLQLRRGVAGGRDVDEALTITMGHLLQGAGLQVDPLNPGRSADVIEEGLARLARNGVIGPYARVVDSSPRGDEAQRLVGERGRGWWAAYAAQVWRFEPSEIAPSAQESAHPGARPAQASSGLTDWAGEDAADDEDDDFGDVIIVDAAAGDEL